MITSLGTNSDQKIADKIGVCQELVSRKRRALDIPIYSRQWDLEDIKLMGTMSDHNLAKLLHLSQPTVRLKRIDLGIHIFDKKYKWRKSEMALIGKMPYQHLADKLGIKLAHVRYSRELLGIPSTCPQTRTLWTDAMISLLGTDIDKNIAKLLNIKEGKVFRKRSKLKISPFKLG